MTAAARLRIAVVGDALLDRDLVGSASRLAPDAPVPVLEEEAERVRPGGAALAAVLVGGASVTLVTALAEDAGGSRLRSLLRGLAVCAAPLAGPTMVKTRVLAGGRSLLRVDRGGGGPVGAPPAAAYDALATADAVLVSDYGYGLTAVPRLREALERAARRVPVVWDPHPRGAEPVPGCRLVTPNAAEAARYAGRPLDSVGELNAAAVELAARWRAGAVAVTLGARGALLSRGDGPPLVVPAPPVSTVDTCGAGDRFAATAVALLGAGKLPSEAVTGAVLAAAEFVAAGAASGLPEPGTREPQAAGGTGGDAIELAARVRARGGTVVATGGCFDLLHAGHVELLAAARRLGDCLVVCVNSDDSVRRLKGQDRPVVGEQDRTGVLRALSTVDATVLFDEDDPCAVLRRLRPHLWVKGGDYGGVPLPEAAVLSDWGGQAVLLPYLDGYSTTDLIDQCRAGALPGRPNQERS